MKTSVQRRAGPAWREFPVLLIKMLLQTEASVQAPQTVTRPAKLIVQIFFPRQPAALVFSEYSGCLEIKSKQSLM